jgi:hypothetical protein
LNLPSDYPQKSKRKRSERKVNSELVEKRGKKNEENRLRGSGREINRGSSVSASRVTAKRENLPTKKKRKPSESQVIAR